MENTIKTNEAKGFYKLSWLQRIGFGSGDLAQNLIYQTVCMYLLIFYTNVYGPVSYTHLTLPTKLEV